MTDADKKNGAGENGTGENNAPAAVSWCGDVPYSDVFGDVYFSEEDGFAETRHTFLDGNRLVDRWCGAGASDADVPSIFRIGETGFGTGLNFLVAWQAFDQHAPADRHLSFVSVEAFPLSRGAMARAVRAWPELSPYAQRLAEIYPTCLEGWHRLAVSPRVTLTLGFGPAEAVLADAIGEIDAWFLDGFAPGTNPDMWSPAVFAQIARLSRPGTTLATFTAAGFVRRGLEAVGFAMDKRPGYGRKREMLAGAFGVFGGHGDVRAPDATPWFNVPPPCLSPDQNAIVIGGGVAGVSAGAALRRRGWQVTVLEAGPEVARGTSGNPAPLIKPKLMQRGTPEADFYRQCYLYAMQLLRGPDAARVWRQAERAGAVQLALREDAAQREAAIIASGVLPDNDARWLTAAELSTLLGGDVVHPGTYFPRGGALDGPAVCRFLAEGLAVRCDAAVSLLDWQDGAWIVRDAAGAVLGRAAHVVLAAGHSVSGLRLQIAGQDVSVSPFADIFQWSVGDLFRMPAAVRVTPVPVSFGKHVVPCADGAVIAGATFRRVSAADGPAPVNAPVNAVAPSDAAREMGVRDLVRQLSAVFGVASAGGTAALYPLWSGIRTSTPDRLPVVGPVPDAAAYQETYKDLRFGRAQAGYPAGRFLPGLYAVLGLGARGFSTAYLCGELVASMIAGDVLPVPRAVMEKLHPARFLIRALRRGRS